jgi:hypothetical protein
MQHEQLFVESSRALAARTLKEPGDVDARLRGIFRRVTARVPDSMEMEVLRGTLQENLKRYQADPQAAEQLIRVGESRPDASLRPQELAAWTMVSNLLLNLDEVINR